MNELKNRVTEEPEKVSRRKRMRMGALQSKLERLTECQRYAALNFGDEFTTETRTFTFVPCAGFDKLCTGGTME